jgi:hypothetical protein
MPGTDQETEKKDAATDAKPQSKTAAEPEMTFPVTALVERAPEYLNVPRHYAAGGLSGSSGELSIKAAQAKINKWLNPQEA